MPLVYAGAGEQRPITKTQERARKIDPRFTRGELVRVATAQNQAEAEMLQGLLLQEGIPSLTKRSGGFDVADFLAAGPRDVLVNQSAEEAARELLTGRAEPPRDDAPGPRPARLLFWMLAIGAAMTGVYYLRYLLG